MSRHFVYYPNGGPYPGTCAMCGNPKDFYDIQVEHRTGGSTLLCTRCISELASAIGFIEAAPVLANVENLIQQVETMQAQLQAVPNLVEGLIDGIRNSTTAFVLDVSGIGNSDSDAPVSQPKRTVKRNQQSVEDPKRQSEARNEPALNERPTGISASAGGVHFTNGE